MNRFLSILFIVALGSGFLAGLLAASPDMYETADAYMDRYRWYDLDIKGVLGLTREDAEAVRAAACTETVQAVRCRDMVLQAGETTCTARVMALLGADGYTETVRQELLDGRMPSAPGECAVQLTMGRYAGRGFVPGDTLVPAADDPDNDGILEHMTADRLTVTGIVRSPMSISVEADPTNVGSGSIALIVYAREDLFDNDDFTDLFVRLKGAAELNTFDDAYTALRTDAVELLRKTADERGALRAAELRDAFGRKLSDGEGTAEALRNAAQIRGRMTADAAARSEMNAAAAELLGASKLSEFLAAIPGAEDRSEIPFLAGTEGLIADARDTLAKIPDDSWLIRTRDDSAGFASYRSNVEKVSALSRIFPVFFFAVALLVALTTMTRLVEENRSQTGTLRSIGFTGRELVNEYLLYALAASLPGCAIGLIVGFRLFPAAIAGAYGMMYMLPEVNTPFRPMIALLTVPVTIGGILAATLAVCRKELKQVPAELMRPKAPKPGKRIWLERIPPVWSRVSFIWKVTLRNIFRYKKRFVMTLVGVAGCSALLVTGFGLRDSINDIVDKQFGEIYRYELTLAVDDAPEAEADAELNRFLTQSGYVEGYMFFGTENGKVINGGKSGSAALCVPGCTEMLDTFITLRERVSGRRIALEDGGVVLTEKLCDQLGISVGDTVMLEDAEGHTAMLPVSGVTENYLTAFAYLTPETFRNAFPREMECNSLLCVLTEAASDPAAVNTAAMRSSHVIFARNTQTLKDTFADSIRSIDAVVLVLILAAGVLSIVVLYNLTNVNICERRKELATVAVLGFTRYETERYILRETDLLSLLGVVIGLFAGIWLHRFVVRTVEVDAVMFGRQIYPMSFVYAFVIAMLFTFLTDLLMCRRIRETDMAGAMKAND